MYAQDLYDLSHTYPAVKEKLLSVATPWEALDDIKTLIQEIAEKGVAEGTLKEIEPGIWVGEGVTISPTATIGAPCIIGAGCELRPSAFLRGSVILGEGCVVGNSTEIKNAILFDGVQAPHFNYIGDSIMGYKSHIGAGVILSNFRLDHGEIHPHWEPAANPRRKAGALIGDGAEVGCNSVVYPGTVIQPGTHIFPLSRVRGWGKIDG